MKLMGDLMPDTINDLDVNAKDFNGYTQLDLAIQQHDTALVQELLQHKADPIISTDVLGTAIPVHDIILMEKTKAKPTTDMMNSYSNYLENKHSRNNALHLAASLGYEDIVEVLCQSNPQLLNVENGKKFTPLHIAAIYGHAPVVDTLIKYGADKDAKNLYNDTPLSLAIYHERPESTEALIKAGANQKANNNFSSTHLHSAAIRDSSASIVEVLIKNGLDVEAKDEYGYTPLHQAAQSNCIHNLEILIKHRADIDAKNKYGNTPLYNAVQNDHIQSVGTLIKNGADINAKDEFSFTPIYSIVKYHQAAIPKILDYLEQDIQDHIKLDHEHVSGEMIKKQYIPVGNYEVFANELIKNIDNLYPEATRSDEFKAIYSRIEETTKPLIKETKERLETSIERFPRPGHKGFFLEQYSTSEGRNNSPLSMLDDPILQKISEYVTSDKLVKIVKPRSSRSTESRGR